MTESECRCRRCENWPPPYRRRCSCRACRNRHAIDELANRSLNVALAHAQNRFERDWDSYGTEATIDKDLSVIWGRRQNLQTWRNAPTGRPGDTPPNKSGQFLYKLFLGSDTKPLYLGRVTGRNTSLVTRIGQHVRNGKPISGLTPQGVGSLIAANRALIRANNPAAKSEHQLIDDILASLPPSAFQISFSEVKRIGRSGKRTGARAADTAMVEKRYHRRGASRINSPDNPRFEEAVDFGGSEDPALVQLVNRVASRIGTRPGVA